MILVKIAWQLPLTSQIIEHDNHMEIVTQIMTHCLLFCLIVSNNRHIFREEGGDRCVD